MEDSEGVWLGNAECPVDDGSVGWDFVEIDGEPHARISGVDRMTPFLMSLVSAGDLWLFAGSNGAFTAGRGDPDGGIFPYRTADKILRHPDSSGATSIFLVRRRGRRYLWEPWRESGRVYRNRRNLLKHVYGTSVVFEETNDDLGLRFRWSLGACGPYGLARECRLTNVGPDAVEVRYLDGWNHLIPPGVSQETYSRYSYLAAGYMRHETVPALPLGIFTLNAVVSDRAEPAESLRAAAAWTLGHADPVLLLSDRQVEAFRRGKPVHPEGEIRGEFAAFLAVDAVTLAPGAEHRWVQVADTKLDPAALVRLEEELKSPDRLDRSLREAVAADRDGVRRLIAAADGIQLSADATADAHHFANTLFNCMRGGTFLDSYRFPKSDLSGYLRAHSRPLEDRHAGWLASLPEALTLDRLRSEAARRGDPQLARLARQYLPLTFSRRHGDPSRPWNHFSIRVRDESDRPVYGYQGNWRDLFQNWESLARSYPGALEAMVAVFLNASTADGYNPYRITRDGIDWEVHNPDDPWSHIGYRGDHQIVYLLCLLEGFDRFRPGALAEGLREEVYSFARVPYEIAGFAALVADPRHSITFDHPLHLRLLARSREVGADGKLAADPEGEVLLVSLAEKLLVPLLAKLSNLVPEGGIWLDTQRPEWNDANNALAGWGLSMVTVQYVRRYLSFLDRILDGADGGPISLSAAVAEHLARTTAILEGAGPAAGRGFDDAERFRVMAELGLAGEAYRSTLYRDGPGGRSIASAADLRALVRAALPVVDGSIRANRRQDGLYHSYNILRISGGDRAEVRPLTLMLEGQVAALSSGLLLPEEETHLLKALRGSDLYRTDQKSYLLYPDRELPPYLRKNTLPTDAAERAPLLSDLVVAAERSLVTADLHGRMHFNADLHNAGDVADRLDRLAESERWRPAVERDRQAVLDLWEAVFRHGEFTGRSGTFFMFEGLGSIYWHMVAKLLVAIGECRDRAIGEGADAAAVAALTASYREVRDGLGFRKSPAEYGAFPTDPYSHTPRHKGAQQPGMTGQVKEEILTRWGEFGIEVKDGRLRFAPSLLEDTAFSPEPRRFRYLGLSGEDREWDLPAGSVAFACCQVPVCYYRTGAPEIAIERADGRVDRAPGNALSAEDSASIFGRKGQIVGIRVGIPDEPPGSEPPGALATHVPITEMNTP